MMTDAERFRLHVATTPSGCWLWTGSVGSTGYGQIGIGSRAAGTFKMASTHRFALEQALGRSLLPGMWALHTCDIRICVRNDEVGFYEVNGVRHPRRGHLWEGTTRDNTADRETKGRGAQVNGAVLHPETLSRGADRYNARFTEDDVRAIRRRVADGERPIDLAHEYGVWKTTIHKIVHRESWRHV